MGKYQAYPKYKDLGGEWFGDIPDHWVIYSSKRLFPESKKRAALEDLQLSATQDYGVISQERFMRLAGRRVVQLNSNQELRKRVDIGDFVISMRSFQGGLERAWEAGGIRSSYVVLKPVDGIVRGYFQYLFKSTRYVQALQSTANFIRDGQDMNYQNFILIDLPCPSVQEQHTISAFLDHETAKIDTLIDKQQQLIQLLKEKRQAVISHAVTKGLPSTTGSNAPMRDSGVEWLGEVPEHWSFPKVKWFFKTESGGTPNTSRYEEYYQDGDIPWIRSTDLNNNELFETPIAITSKAIRESACTVIPTNSVLIAMYGGAGTIGKHALLKFESAINQAVCAILPTNKINPDFLHLYVEFYRPYWMVGAEGARKDPNINQETIRELVVSSPPYDEQVEIVKVIQQKIAVIDQTVSKCEKNIQLMQERRTALISAAVTGKIDVRDWQVPAPMQSKEAV